MDYGLDGRFSIPDRVNILLLSTASRPAWGSTQPPIQWIPGFLFPGGESGKGVKLTTHLYLVPKSGMVELYLHSPTSSLHSAGLSKHRDNFTVLIIIIIIIII
jgi:hypothetical protein